MKESIMPIVSNGFYMWFNLKERKEYYATPLYLYSVIRKKINPDDETNLELILEEDISKRRIGKESTVIKNPSTLYIHYTENLGSFIINFLNADFSTYEMAYNTFFFAYGFELIKEYAPEKYNKTGFISDKEFKEVIKEIYEKGKSNFIEWQKIFRKCVDFVYNLHGNEDLKDEEDILAKFTAYSIKSNDLYTFSKDTEIITDDYIEAHNKYKNESIKDLIEKIKSKDQELELHNIYTSNKLTSMCFTVLNKVIENNLQIKTCVNCGRYFIPSTRQNEIYCELPNIDHSPTCREKGANEQYKKSLENNKTQALYRKIYRQKFMLAQRKPKDNDIQNDFTNWKKVAKVRMNELKRGNITDEEVYKWLEENK